jgi:hypothetical protein
MTGFRSIPPHRQNHSGLLMIRGPFIQRTERPAFTLGMFNSY